MHIRSTTQNRVGVCCREGALCRLWRPVFAKQRHSHDVRCVLQLVHGDAVDTKNGGNASTSTTLLLLAVFVRTTGYISTKKPSTCSWVNGTPSDMLAETGRCRLRHRVSARSHRWISTQFSLQPSVKISTSQASPCVSSEGRQRDTFTERRQNSWLIYNSTCFILYLCWSRHICYSKC